MCKVLFVFARASNKLLLVQHNADIMCVSGNLINFTRFLCPEKARARVS